MSLSRSPRWSDSLRVRLLLPLGGLGLVAVAACILLMRVEVERIVLSRSTGEAERVAEGMRGLAAEGASPDALRAALVFVEQNPYIDKVAVFEQGAGLPLAAGPRSAGLQPDAGLAALAEGGSGRFGDPAAVRGLAVWLPAGEGPARLLVITHDHRAMLHTINDSLVLMSLMLGGVLLGALGAIWLVLERRVLRPLLALHRFTEAWSEAGEDAGLRADLGSPDELGRLSASLDTLIASLRASRAQAVGAAEATAQANAQVAAAAIAMSDSLLIIDENDRVVEKLGDKDRTFPAGGAPLPAAAGELAVEPLQRLLARGRAEGRAVGAALPVARDGRPRWLEPSVARVGADRVLLALRDVSDRVSREHDHAASEQRFRELFELSPAGIALTEPSTGAILRVNRALERLLAPAVPARSDDIFVGGDPADLQQIRAQLAAQGSYGPTTLTLRPAGRELPVLATGVRVIEPSGRIVVWSIVQDLRERRDFEGRLLESKAAVERANARLVQTNHELESTTTQLAVAYEQARKLTDIAQSASRAKSAFLAAMSHEIRTPLNGVVGMGQLLEDGLTDPTDRRLARRVVEGGLQLQRLLSDVLLYAQLEGGQIAPGLREVGLRAVLEPAVEPWRAAAEAKGVALQLSLRCPLTQTLRTEPELLGRALDLLLSNAVKFTEQGQIDVVAQVDGGRLQIQIDDTGPGVRAEDLPRLFSPFEQVDGSTTRRHGGVGLGLALCRLLVSTLDGEIGVGQAEGGGARFYLRLPLFESPSQPMLKLRRALVVDEGAFGRAQLAVLLESWGASVQLCGQVGDALSCAAADALAQDPVQVVFLSSELSTELLLALIPELQALRPPPALLLVGAPAPAPFAGLPWVPRPVTPAGLYDRVMDALSAGQPAPPPAPAGPVSAPAPELGRLLLVEDNVVNQQLAVILLERMGHPVDVAEDGAAALRAMRANHYTLVLMDCMMPVMDGYEATAAVRRGEAGEHSRAVPIIAVTANAMRGDDQRCYEAGMDDYLAKPVRFEALRAAVERWNGRRSGDPAT